jgi:hypothetical protein
MKRAIFLVVAMVVLTGIMTGCASHRCSGLSKQASCKACGGHGCQQCCPQQACQNASPAAAVAYPYYTVRGPRDFLDKNPESIGP